MIRISHRDGTIYDATVETNRGTTTHEVAVWPSDVARYAPNATPEALLEASFEVLLAREPRSSSASSFP